MRMVVIDGLGIEQYLIVQSQGTPVDQSGAIAVAGASEELLAANALRSGWYFQNISDNVLNINELGGSAADASVSIAVYPGDVFPPPGYPVVTGVVNVSGGAAGQKYICREW